MQVQGYGGGREQVMDAGMSDVEGVTRAFNSREIDVNMSDGESNGGGGVPLPGPAKDSNAIGDGEDDDEISDGDGDDDGDEQYVQAGQLSGQLTMYPARAFLQDPIAFAKGDMNPWHLPIVDGVSAKTARNVLGQSVTATENLYRLSCDRIRKHWRVEPDEALPAIVRATTPYPLSLLYQLQLLSSFSRDDRVHAQSILQQQWRKRLHTAKLLDKDDEYSEVLITIEKTSALTLGQKTRKIMLCENTIHENVFGITSKDVKCTTEILGGQYNEIVKYAGAMPRKEAIKLRQGHQGPDFLAFLKKRASSGTLPGQVQVIVDENRAEKQAKKVRREASKKKKEARKERKERARRTASQQAQEYNVTGHDDPSTTDADIAAWELPEAGGQPSMLPMYDARWTQAFMRPLPEPESTGALLADVDVHAFHVATLQQQHEERAREAHFRVINDARFPQFSGVCRPQGFVHPMLKKAHSGEMVLEDGAHAVQDPAFMEQQFDPYNAALETAHAQAQASDAQTAHDNAAWQQQFASHYAAVDESREESKRIQRELKLERKMRSRGISPSQAAQSELDHDPSQAETSAFAPVQHWSQPPSQLPEELSLDNIYRARNGELPTTSQLQQPAEMFEAPEDYVNPLRSNDETRFRFMAVLVQNRLQTNYKNSASTMDEARAASFQERVKTARRGGNHAGDLPMETFDFNGLGSLEKGLVEERVKQATSALGETTLKRREWKEMRREE